MMNRGKTGCVSVQKVADHRHRHGTKHSVALSDPRKTVEAKQVCDVGKAEPVL